MRTTSEINSANGAVYFANALQGYASEARHSEVVRRCQTGLEADEFSQDSNIKPFRLAGKCAEVCLKTRQPFDGILNRCWRWEVLGWLGCGYCLRERRLQRVRASKPLCARPEDGPVMRTKPEPAQSMRPSCQGSWSSAKGRTALERNCTAPAPPSQPSRQPWRSGEPHGGDSRRASATLRWPEGHPQAAPASTTESEKSKARGAS